MVGLQQAFLVGTNHRFQKGYTLDSYEIKPYAPDLLPQVAELMKHLWTDDHQTNSDYFKWKHVDNPYLDHPLGIVALHGGKIVGFRGFFATRWTTGKGDGEFTLLSPGDTCVHPDHRKKGLSVAMATKAMQELDSRYKVFLNLSSSPNSVPGYQRLGFLPLLPKRLILIFGKRKRVNDTASPGLKGTFKKSGIRGILRSISKKQDEIPSKKVDIEFREFGDIIVSDAPRPDAMHSVVSKQKKRGSRFRLVQDETFFRWRFSNKRNRYIFYYYKTGENITGYIVIGAPPDKYQRMVMDFSESKPGALERILEYIIESKHFDRLSIPSFSLNDDLKRAMKNLGLDKNISSNRTKATTKDEMYLLVRPVKEKHSDKDWFINGLDIRSPENWEIKTVCSDGE